MRTRTKLGLLCCKCQLLLNRILHLASLFCTGVWPVKGNFLVICFRLQVKRKKKKRKKKSWWDSIDLLASTRQQVLVLNHYSLLSKSHSKMEWMGKITWFWTISQNVLFGPSVNVTRTSFQRKCVCLDWMNCRILDGKIVLYLSLHFPWILQQYSLKKQLEWRLNWICFSFRSPALEGMHKKFSRNIFIFEKGGVIYLKGNPT